MSTLPIGDYAMLSDCRSAALVSRAVGHTDYPARPGAAAWSVAGLDAPAHGAA